MFPWNRSNFCRNPLSAILSLSCQMICSYLPTVYSYVSFIFICSFFFVWMSVYSSLHINYTFIFFPSFSSSLIQLLVIEMFLFLIAIILFNCWSYTFHQNVFNSPVSLEILYPYFFEHLVLKYEIFPFMIAFFSFSCWCYDFRQSLHTSNCSVSSSPLHNFLHTNFYVIL